MRWLQGIQGEGDSTEHAATAGHSESDQFNFEFGDRMIASGDAPRAWTSSVRH